MSKKKKAEVAGKAGEVYPCYVIIGEEDGEMMELPTQSDGTILLSTVATHFSDDVIGLRYQTESGIRRGVRVCDNIINAPVEGWGSLHYYVVRDNKRKLELQFEDESGLKKKRTAKDLLVDLVVLGLPYTTTEEELKIYFEQFGELDHQEIKLNSKKRSKGFGFIRFKRPESVPKVLGVVHNISGRNCEVKFPKKSMEITDNIPTKLFIGRLPDGATRADVEECFAEYGSLQDVFIPEKSRGFGFVTFPSQQIARQVLKKVHVVKGCYVNVAYPSTKTSSGPLQKNVYRPEAEKARGFGFGFPSQQKGSYGNVGYPSITPSSAPIEEQQKELERPIQSHQMQIDNRPQTSSTGKQKSILGHPLLAFGDQFGNPICQPVGPKYCNQYGKGGSVK